MTSQQTTEEELDLDYLRYMENLEYAWRRSLPRINEAELLLEIPNRKGFIQSKINEWKELREDIVETIRSKLTIIRQEIENPTAKIFFRALLKVNEGEDLVIIDRHLSRLKWLLAIAEGRKTKAGITDDQKQHALAIPLEQIAEQHTRLRKAGKAFIGLCPFHQEKSPSFYIYPATNSFYCYGCQAGGDAIAFVRQLHGLGFVEAVKLLAP